MFGLIGKNTANIEHESPGRTFILRHISLISLMSDHAPVFGNYNAGSWEVLGNNQPDAVRNIANTEGVDLGIGFFFRTIVNNRILTNVNFSLDSLPANEINEDNRRRRGNNNAFSVAYQDNLELNPPVSIIYRLNRPDLFKFINIDDSGQGGGGDTINNTNVIGPFVGLSRFKNVDRLFVSKSQMTDMDLPPNLVSLEMVSPNSLLNLTLPDTVKFLFLNSATNLSNIIAEGDNIEVFEWFNTSLFNLDTFFVNQLNLRKLRLSFAILTTGSLISSNVSFNILDLSNQGPLTDLIIDVDNNIVLYPNDLSMLEEFSLQDDNTIATSKIEEGLTNNLVARFSIVRCNNALDIGLLDSNNLQNVQRIAIQSSGHWNIDLDYSLLPNDLISLYFLNIESTFINIVNTDATSLALQNISNNTSLNLSDNFNITSLILRDINLASITEDVMADIRQMSNITLLDIVETSSVSPQTTIGAVIDLTGLSNLVDIGIQSTNTSSNIILNPTGYNNPFRFQLLDEPNLSGIDNLDMVGTLNNVIIDDCPNLNIDWSVVTNFFGNFIYNDSSVQNIIDLSNAEIVSNGMSFRANDHASLTTIICPQVLTLSILGFFEVSRNPLLTSIVNLDHFETINSTSAGFRIILDNNINLTDLILPFSSTFKIPPGGIFIRNGVLNQASVDGIFDNLYDIRNDIGNGSSINISGGTTPPPTGSFQAPSGFILGSNDGNPISTFEKVYVLVNNYSITVTTN